MLPNSDNFVCEANAQNLSPIGQPIHIGSVPYDIARLSSKEVLVCDGVEDEAVTKISTISTTGDIQVLMQIKYLYERWDLLNDYLLLINKEGDLTHVNLNNKCIDTIKKQHPGHFVEIVHTDYDFVTSGGLVKSLANDQPQRIVKIWGTDSEDKLYCKGRFSTGHTRPIERSLIMNRTNLVTMSKDRKIRIADLIQQSTISVIPTENQDPLSACQIDYNSLIYGGNKPKLSIIDIRTRKLVREDIDFKEQILQLTNMTRLSDCQIVFCNVNLLEIFDLRKLAVRYRTKTNGQTNWALKILNHKQFAIGNRQRFVQFWKAE